MAANELDREVRAELRSLSKTSADTVSRRLVASGELLNVDPELALRHAMAARKIASRIAAVREAVGLAAYQCGQWQLAISELRAFQRMTGRRTHMAVMADAERGLGRPERAVDMFRHTDRKSVAPAEWIELLIVAAGARRDMGQHAAAVTMLQIPALEVNGTEAWRPRLRYAYADSLVEAGRIEEAYRWFARTIELDPQGDTDAVDRLLALEGVVIEGDDLPDDTDDEDEAEQPAGRSRSTGSYDGARDRRPVDDVDDAAPAESAEVSGSDRAESRDDDSADDHAVASATRVGADSDEVGPGARTGGDSDEVGAEARTGGGSDEVGAEARIDGGSDEVGLEARVGGDSDEDGVGSGARVDGADADGSGGAAGEGRPEGGR
ncbi:tetratricopeptide repeat protein [Actinocatenispora rupis]|uniref:Tetratrico peptide repeat-containing protein n=1 Tax=Actinocatenispora rupis TaxID=519421 RepID=A0A8J3NAD0_9ACTN|nr:tetratricopeptide repeat protein [Actinocatenispora rupis]GID11976.1 hypothetical protein Aru02nite_28650 [Actinocatenispora rupis]